MILFQSNNFNNHNMNHISRPPLTTKLVPNKQDSTKLFRKYEENRNKNP